MDLNPLIHYLQTQKTAENYAEVVAVALMMYDYCLTLHLEVKLVWLSSWSYTKIIFLLARYVPMVTAWILLYLQIFPNVSPHTCSMLWPATIWLSVIGTNSAEIILVIRTWAVWRRDWRLGTGLAFLVLGTLIAECVTLNTVIKTVQIVGSLYPGSAGCFVTSTTTGPELFWVCYLAIAVVEGVVLFLMSISAFRAFQSRNTSELVNIIHRDGILFYIYLLCLSLANLLCLRLINMDMLIVPHMVLYSALASRIIFNIRNITNKSEVDTQGKLTELHATLPMEFCAPPHDGTFQNVEDFYFDDWNTTLPTMKRLQESSVLEGTVYMA